MKRPAREGSRAAPKPPADESTTAVARRLRISPALVGLALPLDPVGKLGLARELDFYARQLRRLALDELNDQPFLPDISAGTSDSEVQAQADRLEKAARMLRRFTRARAEIEKRAAAVLRLIPTTVQN